MDKIKSIDIAAALCGCKVGELLGFRERKNGDLSVIAPTGQKFVYAKVLVDGQRKKMAAASKPKPKPKPEPKPRRKAPATRKRAPVKPAASKAKDNSAKKKSVPS